MVLLIIILYITIYVISALTLVFIVRKVTELKIIRWLAVMFVILLPTWDIILGLFVYYPACFFIPKTAIYETAETDGIYYEGDYKNYFFDLSDGVRRVGLDDLDLEKGYKYIESLVTKESINYGQEYKDVKPIVYRCTPLPRNPQRPKYLPIECLLGRGIQSGYLVKVKKVKIGISEIHFMKIRNRSTGKLMAEYNEVTLGNKKNLISFLDWTGIGEGGGSLECCPKRSRFYDFQYDVLKPKQ